MGVWRVRDIIKEICEEWMSLGIYVIGELNSVGRMSFGVR